MPGDKGSDKIKRWSFGNAQKEQLVQYDRRYHLHWHPGESPGASGSREVGVRKRDRRVRQQKAIAWMKACKRSSPDHPKIKENAVRRRRNCKRRWERKKTDCEGFWTEP